VSDHVRAISRAYRPTGVRRDVRYDEIRTTPHATPDGCPGTARKSTDGKPGREKSFSRRPVPAFVNAFSFFFLGRNTRARKLLHNMFRTRPHVTTTTTLNMISPFSLKFLIRFFGRRIPSLCSSPREGWRGVRRRDTLRPKVVRSVTSTHIRVTTRTYI